MESTSPSNTFKVASDGITIGFDEALKPICLILRVDSFEHVDEVAMPATKDSLGGYNLSFRGPKGSLVHQATKPSAA